jgi:hypothetical protein
MVSDLTAMYNTLLNAGFETEELFLITHPDGQHSEWYWAREFPDAYLWLCANAIATDLPSTTDQVRISLSPNPAEYLLHIDGAEHLVNASIQVFSLDGQLVRPPTFLKGDTYNVSFLKRGIYIFNIYSGEHLVASQRLVIH